MTGLQHIYFVCCLIAVDLITMRLLRKLLRDFLRSKKNKRQIIQLHASQPMANRIKLDYIYPLLKHNQRAFKFYHRLYLSMLLMALPEYLILGILCVLVDHIAVYIILTLGIVKIVFYLVIRSNFDANMVSIYRKI